MEAIRMKIDDVLREIYDTKKNAIAEDFRKEKEIIERKKNKLCKSIEKKILAVISEAKQQGLSIVSDYYVVDKRIRVKVRDFKEAEKHYNKRIQHLDKEFIKLKIAIATNQSEHQKLIESFNKKEF